MDFNSITLDANSPNFEYACGYNNEKIYVFFLMEILTTVLLESSSSIYFTLYTYFNVFQKNILSKKLI